MNGIYIYILIRKVTVQIGMLRISPDYLVGDSTELGPFQML